ncbi:MAG: NfeD family protein [bacterium]|nr:NfeD family protein [bacterium]
MTDLANLFLSGPSWIIFGLVLIGLELAVPGAVIIFFGAGAVLTGLLTMAEALPGFQAQLLTWVLSSLVMVLLFRRKIANWFPALERYDPRPEPQEILGRRVEVTEDILPDRTDGLVRFQGANWQAATMGSPIYSGQSAKIVGRKNLLLIVEPVDGESDSGAADAADGAPRSDSDASPYA